VPELPLAYFITFSTYGTRLHGDARGSVDRRGNRPGTRTSSYDERRWEAERAALKTPPVELGARQREAVATAIHGVARHRDWTVHALNVRTNHVHVVVSAPVEPEPVMDTFKRWATRRLRDGGLVAPIGDVWSRHGSTRWVWNDESVTAVVDYIHFGQGDWIDGCGAPRQRSGATATDRSVGLCAECLNARQVQNDRGSTFWLCAAAAQDPALRKYPQLPVLRCHAFTGGTA
jgi:REP element-mobilizing transposase RayT